MLLNETEQGKGISAMKEKNSGLFSFPQTNFITSSIFVPVSIQNTQKF